MFVFQGYDNTISVYGKQVFCKQMKFKYWHQKTFSIFIQSEKNFQYGHGHLHKKNSK